MFGWGEIGILVVLAIVLLGPDKLPEAARKMGKIYAEYNNAKKKFEMEVFYGQDIPQKDFLEKISQNKFNSLKKDISSNITDTMENYLNTGSYNDLDNPERKKSDNKLSKTSASSRNSEVSESCGESKNEEKQNKENS